MFSCHCSLRLFQPLGQVVSPAAGKAVHVTEAGRVVVERRSDGGVGELGVEAGPGSVQQCL